MKRVLFNVFLAGFALVTVPSFAQDKTDKEKGKKDIQQIIITRTGDPDEKTVIEVKGDKVTVNGKDVKDMKDNDVKVKVNKIKDVMAFRGNYVNPENMDFNFNFDHNNAMSLFTEDENRAMLGIVTDSDDKGARITSVNKESGAEKAGLKKDDIITKIDEAKIEDAEDVSKEIRKHKPGDKVNVTFLRGGKEQKVTAELGKWKGIKINASIPRGDRFEFSPDVPGAPFISGFGGAPKLGLSVQDTEDGKGVKVLDVDEDSNAAKAGIKENDVITHINDEAVNNADEIARKVRAARDKGSLQFKVLRNGKAQNIEVKTPRKLKTADL